MSYEVEIMFQGNKLVAHVTSFHCEPGTQNRFAAQSDYDYYGYTDMDYELRDEDGEQAEWVDELLAGLTHREKEQLETLIEESLKDQLSDY